MARPYVITISSEKGGVGKTTLATNLAIYLKGLAEDLPVTLFSFDNHFTVDRMFQLGNTARVGHIGHLLAGQNVSELVCQGQYGVQIIPSCKNLPEFPHGLNSHETLASLLSSSNLGGLVIIDTSPILDQFTRNALFAADRVIVPVKDAPSLENCRNLAGFFTDHGVSKAPLRLLPCLIDTRIRYRGPFKDPYQLLKAYAINRGYRCLEGYIAKSPKVESLNTNPEGKVYPILTHGRGTDVHLQFNHLARQVYLDYLQFGPLRLGEVATQRYDTEDLNQKQLTRRKGSLFGSCLCCGAALPEKVWPNAFYVENTTAQVSGFIEEQCFTDLVFEHWYGQKKTGDMQEALKDLFRDSASRSFFLLQLHPSESGESCKVDFYRLDETGQELSRKSIELKDRGLGILRKSPGTLNSLLKKVFSDLPEGSDQMILLRHGGDNPLKLLNMESYAHWQAVFSRCLMEKSVLSNPESPEYPSEPVESPAT